MPFALEVHLAADGAAELLDQADGVVESNRRGMLLDQVSEPHEDVDVGFDGPGNPRAADLEDHRLTAVQPGQVDLGN